MKYNLKTNATFILFLTLLMLTSCTQNETIEMQLEEKEQQQQIEYDELLFSFEHPKTKQKYKIVHVNPLFKRYIEKVKESPSHLTLELYNEEIIQPVYKDCFENGEFLHMAEPLLIAESLLDSTPEGIAELEIISEKLEIRKEKINELIQESLLKSAELLPSQKDIAVCVFPSNNESMPMVTVGAGKILIAYNQYYNDLLIKIGVAHEYHHSVWAEKYLSNHSATVLDNLIFEGKAVMFEKTVYPIHSYTPVDMTYNKELWSKIEPDLYKQDLYRSLEILHGGKDLPRSYGYSEGYKMIKSYLDLNPNQTPEEWTALSAQEIIEIGKYFDNYK
ncbi:DUF2268 domain-containing putative Zn-dependent protease [Pseudoneobacillus sp. C159]